MLTGRLLLMLVVMTATLAVRSPASTSLPDAASAERAGWVRRLGTGVGRPFSRIGLLQRVALRVPPPPLVAAAGHTTRPARAVVPDPLRACLPPPV